jgi:hypothetical protein
MHVGKVNRPKRSGDGAGNMPRRPEYSITDSFASDSIPSFEARKSATNNKRGFTSKPARSSTIHKIAERPPAPSRGHGKTV